MGNRTSIAATALALLTIMLMLLVLTYLVRADSWVEVVRFEGTDVSAKTELFTCNYPEWRISWEFEPGHWHFPQLHSFSVTTYPQGETTNYIDQIYELANGGKTGIHYIHDYNGTFYMKISPGIIENYAIIVEQNTDSNLAPSPTVSALPSNRVSHFNCA